MLRSETTSIISSNVYENIIKRNDFLNDWNEDFSFISNNVSTKVNDPCYVPRVNDPTKEPEQRNFTTFPPFPGSTAAECMRTNYANDGMY